MANKFLDTNITGDVKIDGPLVLTGLLTAGTAPHVLTTAAGLLAGAKLDAGTVPFAALSTTDFVAGSRGATATGVANVSAVAGGTQVFGKIGRFVVCAGRLNVTPTNTNTLTQVRIDLPFAGGPDANSLAFSGSAARGNSPFIAMSGSMDVATGEAIAAFASDGGIANYLFRYVLAYLLP